MPQIRSRPVPREIRVLPTIEADDEEEEGKTTPSNVGRSLFASDKLPSTVFCGVRDWIGKVKFEDNPARRILPYVVCSL